MRFLYYLITATFNVYTAIVFVDLILSWFPIRSLYRLREWTSRLTEPLLAPIRRVIPTALGLDFSPAILLILINLLEKLLLTLLFWFA
ncbi:YggT family protein [Lacticaseibacillus songhuajiangensis]|uniref:YggT family protein n=1 Tax=Lacticaseibacillus songhuajiangensis TaxID=1296539 RepID=UPI000F7A9913|nr:YggT family protein [Lacticaseibacillus songhuajiangensis]MCI1283117.1 YggT family protein [Lacticaseibacillus songhuajiangensis]